MNRQDVLLQLSICSSMLTGVNTDESMRPDLPVIASKLRLLGKLIPKIVDVPREASDLLADVQRLRQTWGELYWGDEASSEIRASHSRAGSDNAVVKCGPWTIEEERRFIQDLDDTAIRIWTIFGRVGPDAKVNGRWHVRIEKNAVYDAGSLREEFQRMVTPEPTADEWLWAIADDAVLLSAAEGLHATYLMLAELAESVAPAIHELFVNTDPAVVMWQVVGRLLTRGHLHTGVPANCPSRPAIAGVFSLTDAGYKRRQVSLNTWRSHATNTDCTKNPSASGEQQSRTRQQFEDDIPF